MMLSVQELIKLYNRSESRLEKANLWLHIQEWAEIFAEDKYPNEYETSLYYDENYENFLDVQREAFKKGYLEGILLLLDTWDK